MSPRFDESVGFSRAALALRPRSSKVHSDLGSALFNRGDLDEAMAEFLIAIRLNPDNVYAHNNLGAVLARKGLLAPAVIAYREAIRRKPDLDGGLERPASSIRPTARPSSGRTSCGTWSCESTLTAPARSITSLLAVIDASDPADINIVGNEFTASVPLSVLLPAATRPPQEWTYNLWPRNGPSV